MADTGDIGANSDRTLVPQEHGGALRVGGPGRPKAHGEVVQRLRQALFADEHEDRIGVIDALVAKAVKGDIRAIELCLYYAIGKPTEHVDLTVGVRAAASRLAAELGIDDSAVQAEVDALIAGAKK